jgi:hypothetical protein
MTQYQTINRAASIARAILIAAAIGALIGGVL